MAEEKSHRQCVMRWVLVPIVLAGLTQPSWSQTSTTDNLVARAEDQMRRAALYFSERVARYGSYVWEVSSDLEWRSGEGVTADTQGWLQPPGTPAVGRAYLAAFHATGDRRYLKAAIETAEALRATQLESGGWWALLEFDPVSRLSWCYRENRAERPPCDEIEGNKERNATILDDNMSQSALAFLMLVDGTLKGGHEGVREAVVYGLGALLDMQHPNGAWPVRSDRRTADALTVSAWRARMPDRWSRKYVEPEGEVYILNDNLQRDAIRLFILAYRLYGEPEYLAAARRGGEFLLRAQMPGAQPGWAQTYNADLEPIWGRKFEPPSIASNETAGAVDALLELYELTGKRRYLEGAQSAAKWLSNVQLPDEDWARFYELGSGAPLYFDAEYNLSYSAREAPDHYSFKGGFDIAHVLERMEDVGRDDVDTGKSPNARHGIPEAEIEEILATTDRQGRWVEDGKIRSETFVGNLGRLAQFIAHARGRPIPDPTKLLPLPTAEP
ncbi:pectate lyase [Chelativorans salis]|uniref:Pectate lyase n=1 Tax=Chelativorans salis TaxID=2978478 RepID=A0ABT2LQZ2_9HYPH|nr:pectate lyase [Chelativorans sp. EGI FJ00035]MCT7376922.1 pectate lyase [Chelativorans sp. EGI FJ00035]